MTKKGGIEICSASTCGAISVFGKESIYVVAFLIFYIVVHSCRRVARLRRPPMRLASLDEVTAASAPSPTVAVALSTVCGLRPQRG